MQTFSGDSQSNLALDPFFLSVDEVLAMHAEQIERYGGAPGIRDIGLVRSALAQPRATFGDTFLHKDLAEMAAAYLFHLCGNHPFVDGNKRVGLEAALVFLLINDFNFDAPPTALESMTMDVAQGNLGKAEIADFFRSHRV